MYVTKTDIYRGCLIASISHAIMTNVYPELSYEQSWDGANYSIQNSSGMRGTITFENDFCVGAIRNERSSSIVGGEFIQECMRSFPSNVICKAYEETLQYLLLEKDGIVAPYVTSVFWADYYALYYEEKFIDSIKEDFALFENILLPKKIAIEKWKEYYDMDSKVIELIDILYQWKMKDFLSPIELNEKQRKLIPGSVINNQCLEALKELNIVL